jgi:hypothetical protein
MILILMRGRKSTYPPLTASSFVMDLFTYFTIQLYYRFPISLLSIALDAFYIYYLPTLNSDFYNSLYNKKTMLVKLFSIVFYI